MELTNKIDLSIATRIKIKEGEVLSLKIGNEILWNRPYLQRTQNLQKSAKSNSIEVPDDIGSIDKFNREFSRYSIFNKLDILYLLASTDASRDVNFNRIDFIKPTRLGTYNGGLSYGLGGIKGNGTNAYFGTNFNPAIDGKNYTLNNASRGVFVSEIYSSVFFLDGCLDSGNNYIININRQDQRINQGSVNQSEGLNFSGTGLKIINRDSATSVRSVSNSTEKTVTSNSNSIYNSEQFILRRGTTYGDARIGLYFMGGSLTLTDYNIINNAYNNYIS